MTLHPENCRWLVVARNSKGREVRHYNVTAFIGEDRYDEVSRTLRRNLGPDHTLDTTEADAQHQRLLAARERYAEAEAWWMEDTLGRPHPGRLDDYLELP